MKLLVASDLSDRSEVAIERAILLADQLDAELTLLHVVDVELPMGMKTAYMQDANSILHEELSQARQGRAGTGIDVLVRAGDPYEVISEVADETGADLVIVGAYRRQLLRDTFRGTTVERVIRASRRPVLMVNQKADHPYRKTLMAVDLSPISEKILKAAAKFGLTATTSSSLAHAFVAVSADKLAFAGPERELTSKEADQCRQAILPDIEKLVAAYDWPKGQPRLIVEEGNAIKVLRDAADMTGADVLVLGVQGYGAIKRMLIGSVAGEVLSQIGCDILAVPFAD